MGYSYEICDEEVAISLLAHYRIDKADVSERLVKMVETGGGTSHLHAQCHRHRMAIPRPKFDAIARRYSAIITPSCAGESPKKKEFDPETRFCGLWFALHVPVVQIPGFAGGSGLPIGLSLVGARYVVHYALPSKANQGRREDEKLLQVANLVAAVFLEKGNNGNLRKVPS